MSTLVLTAHGSADPRSAAVTHAVAGRIRRLRPWLEVRAAFLEQTSPSLGEVLTVTGDAVVTPFLLASAYHARVDIPSVINESGKCVRRADTLGEDPALLAVLRHRLSEAGVSPDDRDLGVVVVAVGSSDPNANASTATVATTLAVGTRWAGTETAFATGPYANLSGAVASVRDKGARRVVIAPWFLAPGKITDRVATFAAQQGILMSEPLGSHNLVAATVLDRYDAVTAARAAA
ncbi:sirohydrochlorin chelatase [Mycobacterium sp. MS1601]|uniref:sirohydrochlorin chelatase n=1 Tax=Mycobacterium sp. MS1601 TaxID=1936029 RepID=UPI0009796345|nr:sirohydrochlorin chelatase [Mycobacterium sp. MS1601]AQA04541.1 sirohydrochlorin chelatase [Mycobacterium sp. MS1601]